MKNVLVAGMVLLAVGAQATDGVDMHPQGFVIKTASSVYTDLGVQTTSTCSLLPDQTGSFSCTNTTEGGAISEWQADMLLRTNQYTKNPVVDFYATTKAGGVSNCTYAGTVDASSHINGQYVCAEGQRGQFWGRLLHASDTDTQPAVAPSSTEMQFNPDAVSHKG